jgi:hydroxymethylglutaryl-CoA reductase
VSTSRMPGFYRKTPLERRAAVVDSADLSPTESQSLDSALPVQTAAVMVENVIGTFALPLATAVNLMCNGNDVLVPMVVEEPSVVAAVSNMAKLVRPFGGFTAHSEDGIMIGQIQIMECDSPALTLERLNIAKEHLVEMADCCHPRLKERGGGMRGMEFRLVQYDEPEQQLINMVVVHFYLDCVDAMGANMVNTIAETLAPEIEKITGETVGLRILSNLASHRLAYAQCRIPISALETDTHCGEFVSKGIVNAYRFAYADPWRAATHNKGIMNGIDAVAIATGNDWRAIEAGAHAWAAQDGQYRSLSRWKIEDDALVGSLTLPIQVGTVGGSIKTNPAVSTNLKILGNPNAKELSCLMAVVGLAQNLGALRALACEGIQKGHMRMHARNIAIQAGASDEELLLVVNALVKAKDYSIDLATQTLKGLREEA